MICKFIYIKKNMSINLFKDTKSEGQKPQNSYKEPRD